MESNQFSSTSGPKRSQWMEETVQKEIEITNSIEKTCYFIANRKTQTNWKKATATTTAAHSEIDIYFSTVSTIVFIVFGMPLHCAYLRAQQYQIKLIEVIFACRRFARFAISLNRICEMCACVCARARAPTFFCLLLSSVFSFSYLNA